MLQSTPQLPLYQSPSYRAYCHAAAQGSYYYSAVSRNSSRVFAPKRHSLHIPPQLFCLFRASPRWGQHYTDNNTSGRGCTAATASMRYANPCLSMHPRHLFAARNLPDERHHVIVIACHWRFAVDVPRVSRSVPDAREIRHPEARRRTTAKPFMQAQLPHTSQNYHSARQL
jgi:hypothetical protein